MPENLMEILLRDIPAEGLELDFQMDPSDLHLAEDRIGFPEPIRLQLALSKQQDMVLVVGHAKTRLVLECGLCLKKFSWALDQGIQTGYLPARSASREEEERQLEQEELDVMFFTGEALPVDDLVREQIILATPMHPLCSTECRGLCPRCGQDLNLKSCRCNRSEPNPRFSALKEFFKK